MTTLHAPETSGNAGDITQLEEIGRGSFGSVHKIPNRPLAIKQTLEADEVWAKKLLDEFETYIRVDQALKGKSTSSSVFKCPLAHYYHNPISSSTFLSHKCTTDTESLSPVLKSLDKPYFVMQAIPPLPDQIQKLYQHLFWEGPILTSKTQIRLARLYFGRNFPPKTYEPAPGTIQTDPPLDLRRYELLQRAIEAEPSCKLKLPSVDDISWEMGRILALLHWEVGTNAGDVELVLGGSTDEGGGFQTWILDYNQSATWILPNLIAAIAKDEISSSASILTKGAYKGLCLKEAIGKISKFLSFNERYYPRQDLSPALYNIFRSGYISSVESLLAQYTPSTPSETWIQFTQEVREAVRNFFLEIEGAGDYSTRVAPKGLLNRRVRLEDLKS